MERIRQVLSRISSSATKASAFVLTETAPQARNGAAVVLPRAYAVGSVMLWVAYFMGLLIFYALINWMPVLFKDAELQLQTAALISALGILGLAAC